MAFVVVGVIAICLIAPQAAVGALCVIGALAIAAKGVA
jgi:hypothetical protein